VYIYIIWRQEASEFVRPWRTNARQVYDLITATQEAPYIGHL
jgi:hypothetical protein